MNTNQVLIIGGAIVLLAFIMAVTIDAKNQAELCLGAVQTSNEAIVRNVCGGR